MQPAICCLPASNHFSGIRKMIPTGVGITDTLFYCLPEMAEDQGKTIMNYASIAIAAVEALVENGPVIVEDISALLKPLKEGRAPTADEWDFAEKQLDAANAAVQAG
ncbi:hypothetical protein S101447_02710 [Acetobacter ascendens]|uniref:Uncharacterized protein n=3 Tax=Acetobacter TaxID=434 RepID=A0A1Y0V7U0_9PROT|nr:hypothetical protein S101447_02710 [Acetobacter ascendens]